MTPAYLFVIALLAPVALVLLLQVARLLNANSEALKAEDWSREHHTGFSAIVVGMGLGVVLGAMLMLAIAARTGDLF